MSSRGQVCSGRMIPSEGLLKGIPLSPRIPVPMDRFSRSVSTWSSALCATAMTVFPSL